MAIYSIDKAVGLARDLADRLKIRFSNGAGINTVRQSQDANGWPLIFLSAGANEVAGQPVIGIRIQNIDVGAKDVFGNATQPFAPHQAEIAFELDSDGAIGQFAVMADWATAFFEVSRMGTIVIVEPLADGQAVTEAHMNTALAAGPSTVLKDIDWRNSGNV